MEINDVTAASFLGPKCLLVLLAFDLVGLFGLLLLLDLRRELFVALAGVVQVVEVEHADDVLLLEDELLDFSGDDGRNSAGLFPVLEEDEGWQLPGQGRRVDVVLRANVRVAADVDLAWRKKGLGYPCCAYLDPMKLGQDSPRDTNS